MHFFRDFGVSSVLESSCTLCTLRFSARCFLELTEKSLFLEVPFGALSRFDDLEIVGDFSGPG